MKQYLLEFAVHSLMHFLDFNVQITYSVRQIKDQLFVIFVPCRHLPSATWCRMIKEFERIREGQGG
jgi:hypothetical protein